MGSGGVTKKEMLERIVAAKQARRKELARLPFEKKFQMVVELKRLSGQARAAVAFRAREVKTNVTTK